MSDNFSEIDQGASCYALANATTIYSYKNGIRTTFVQISGAWRKTQTSAYYNLPDNYVCYSYADITSIDSYSYMLPFYHLIAFVLAFFVVFLFWFFIKRLFKWRG